MATSIHDTGLQVNTSNRQVLKIALPISLAIFVPQFNLIINNIFLGHYNQESLAIASIAGVYYLVFAMIGFGLNNGLQTLIARRAGENRPEEIGKIFAQGVLISFIIAAIGIATTWMIAPLILPKLISADHAAQVISFLKIRIWGLPFLYIYQMRNALLVGTNQSKFLVTGTLAETITNIVFDYLFIFGNAGFPELGFNGAAVASIIAEFMGMFVIFAVIHYKGIGRRFALFGQFAWNSTLAKQIMTISLPLIFQFFISLLSWEYFYILIEHHGETALAASNVMRNIFGFLGCITWAFAATTAAMVSNLIGQGKKELVIPLIIRIMKISVGSSCLVVLLINLFPTVIFSIYGQDQAFISIAVPLVRIVTVAMIIMAFGVTWLNAVIGTGNSRVTFLIELIVIVLYCIYIYLVLEKYFLSVTVGWMSEWLYWGTIFIFSFLYMRSGKWKKKVI